MVTYMSSALHSPLQVLLFSRDSKMLLLVTSLNIDPLSLSLDLKYLENNFIQ